MWDTLILLSFCVLMGLLSLAVCVWTAVSGSLFTLDGIVVALISLTVGGIFMVNVVWSFFTGELQEALRQLRSGSKTGTPNPTPPASS